MVLAAIWVLTPSFSYAQSEGDEGEVAALGGISFAGGEHPAVTGSAGVAFSRYGMVVLDTSFLPLGNHTIQSWPDRSNVEHSYLFDFGVDFHIRIPVNKRWAPYGIAGTGLLWNTISAHTTDRLGRYGIAHYNQFNGALHTGGGVRYYVREGWGVRSEVKVIVSKQTYTQLLMGVFYVTPSNWP